MQCKEREFRSHANTVEVHHSSPGEELGGCQVRAAYDDALTCEEGFTESGGGASPLKKETGKLIQLCSIALSITHLLNA